MMKASKGFTLVELIVVIAIIAILAAVSIVGYNQFIQNARDSRAETELSVIQRQVEAHYYVDGDIVYSDNGVWAATEPDTPVAEEDLKVTVSYNPNSAEFTLSFEIFDADWRDAVSDSSDTSEQDFATIDDYTTVVEEALLAAVNAALDDDETPLTTDDLAFDVTLTEDAAAFTATATYTVDNGTASWDVTGETTPTPDYEE